MQHLEYLLYSFDNQRVYSYFHSTFLIYFLMEAGLPIIVHFLVADSSQKKRTFSMEDYLSADFWGQDSKKAFLWTYERNGFINLNVKVSPAWRDFWRDAFPSVIPGWHQNKDNWNTIILDGSIPDDAIKNMIADSYDLVTYNPTRLIYEAVKRIPKGCVATYAQVAELAGNKKMCRAVGNALHKNPNPDEIPCYRVVNAKGELSGAFAFGGADEQAKRLRADGIDVIDGRVDLDKYGIRIADDIIHTKTTVEPFT